MGNRQPALGTCDQTYIKKKINPLKSKSASKITITSTNLRGSRIGTHKEIAKINTFLNLASDINIVIDSHLTEQKLISLKKKTQTTLCKIHNSW